MLNKFRTIIENMPDASAYPQGEKESLQNELISLLRFQEEMLDTAVIWINIIDEEGNVTFWNKTAELISGYTAEEVIGNNRIWDWLYPNAGYKKDVLAKAKIIIRNGIKEQSEETRIKRKDGQYRIISWHSNNLIVKGKVVGSISLGADITEVRQAEKALRESENKLSVIFNSCRDAMVIHDINCRMIEVNKAACEHLGYSREELLNKSMSDFVPQEYSHLIPKRIHKILKSGSHIFESVDMNRKGEVIPIEVNATTIEYDGKRAILSVIRDISERKQMEQEIFKVDKLESIGILAGGIAHDFNNLLTIILGNVSLSKLQLDKGSKVYPWQLEIEKAVRQAKDLTHQLLTFARGGEPVKKLICLGELLEGLMPFSLPGSSITVRTKIAPNLPPVNVDAGQISQVVNNLLINAAQSMPEGGSTYIEADTAILDNDYISSTGYDLEPGKYVRITIKDEGTGIPENILGKIFDPFFTTKDTGSGLGLAVCYSIIRNHKGHISVESNPGKGAVFHVYLPVEVGGDTVHQKKDLLYFGEGRVLLMEDDEGIRNVVGEILKFLGYDAFFVKDGSEAIEAYKETLTAENPFNVVIMDLTIRGSAGGKEVIKRLLEIDKNVKVIVSSGYSNDAVMTEYKKFGFSGVVAKPYNIEELSRVLHYILSKDA